MDTVTKKAAVLIKFLRKRKKFSQTILAEALDIPVRTYQNWEKDFSSKLNYLNLICEFYNIDLQLFFKLLNYPSNIWDNFLDEKNSVNSQILEDIFNGFSISELENKYKNLKSTENSKLIINNIIRNWYFDNNKKSGYYNNFNRNETLEKEIAIKTKLPIENIRVVNTSPIKNQLLKEIILGKYGSLWIKEFLENGNHFSLGISNGYTVSRILDNLERGSVKNLELFPLNFTKSPVDFSISSTSLISSFCYKHEGVSYDFKPTTEVEVYSAVQLCDAMLLGIGTFSQNGLYSKMIETTLGKQKLSEIINKKACGDLNYYIFNEQGKIIDDKSLVSAISPQENDSLIKAVDLKLIQKKADRGCRIIVAAAGSHKAKMVNLAIKENLINHLLIDNSLAVELLNCE